MTETERPSALTGHIHVREAEDFDSVYMQGVPPWDIGRSQPAFAELAERGLLAGRVLDAGCGTGEQSPVNALVLSSLASNSTPRRPSYPDGGRPRFVKELRASMPVGGHYYMLCFSDSQAGDWGPRRIRQEEIRDSFAEGWTVDSIQPAKIDITIDPHQAEAWLAVITRL